MTSQSASLLKPLAFLVLVVTSASSASAGNLDETQTTKKRTVLVELFTSQGCSSCPPADALLSQINALNPDIKVIPLAFHVDYWNKLGWRDPYSKPQWTERQRRYATRKWPNRVYTPQLVIQGKSHTVGSSKNRVQYEIRKALMDNNPGSISFEKIETRGRHFDIQLGYSLTEPRKTDLALYLAVKESGLITPILRGENRSETLRNDHIVRALKKFGALSAGTKSIKITENIYIPPNWNVSSVQFVIFAQDLRTGQILTAASSP